MSGVWSNAIVGMLLAAGACTPSAASRSGEQAPSTADQLAAPGGRTTPPTLAPPPKLTLPPVAMSELPNGLRLFVVEKHELPVADFILLVGTGSEADPAPRSGLALITAGMLDEGAAGRSALEIADQEAFLGIRLSAGSGWDASTISLHTPTGQLDSALALFADVALRPDFSAGELERVRKERLTELVQLRDDPPAIADRAYASIVFGTQHPYGRPQTGTEASITAISRSDLRRFYDTYYRPNNAALIVVGDVSPADVGRRVEHLFGRWQRGAVPMVQFGNVPPVPATTVYLIDKPGAPQSSFRIGGVGVPRSTADYFALQVMNTILGGSFTSRLNQNLRETHGYTYGAGSSFSMRRKPGPFTARAEVVGAKSDSALMEFMRELRSIRDTVPAAELDRAKRYLELRMPAQFETTGRIAAQLVPVVLYGLPHDFYDSYVQRIGQVTQADVQRVALRYLDPDRMAVVVVGDRKSIEPELRALGIAPVKVRTLEDSVSAP
jgi:zinc protease